MCGVIKHVQGVVHKNGGVVTNVRVRIEKGLGCRKKLLERCEKLEGVVEHVNISPPPPLSSGETQFTVKTDLLYMG